MSQRWLRTRAELTSEFALGSECAMPMEGATILRRARLVR